jgi:hypothetical protein
MSDLLTAPRRYYTVSRSLIDKDVAYSERLAKSGLVIELRHDGPVIVRLCAPDDEDTTYLLVEFYTY